MSAGVRGDVVKSADSRASGYRAPKISTLTLMVAQRITRYPRSWAGIAVGSLVLIWGESDDGWYEAVVVARKAGGEFELHWRDWPDLPLEVRRRDQMALLHPNAAAAVEA